MCCLRACSLCRELLVFEPEPIEKVAEGVPKAEAPNTGVPGLPKGIGPLAVPNAGVEAPKAGLLSVLPAPNEKLWFFPAGVGVPRCAPEIVAVKLKPPDVAVFCGVAGAPPNAKVGASKEAALTGKALVFPKAKTVEALPNADCVELPNVGAAVLAGVPNGSGATAVPPPTLVPNVKGLTGVGAGGLAKHVEELNTEVPNVACVAGVFDVMGVLLFAIPNCVKEVVAGLWPKVNVF